jgi:hypothetical protein
MTPQLPHALEARDHKQFIINWITQHQATETQCWIQDSDATVQTALVQMLRML